MKEVRFSDYFSDEYLTFVKKGEPIHEYLDEWEHIFYLQRGLAIVKRVHEDGTEELLRFGKGKTFLGFANYFTTYHQLTESDTLVYACTDCIIYKIPHEIFRKYSYEHPEVLEAIILQMTLQNRIFRKQVDCVAHKQTLQALAALFVNLCVETSDGLVVPSCVSNNDIAMYLKIHFVTVSKLIHLLIQNNILEKRDNKLFIVDYPTLLDISNGMQI